MTSSDHILTRCKWIAPAIMLAGHAVAQTDQIIQRPTPPPFTFGEGAFPLTQTPATVPSIVSADFNNDGHPDLAWLSTPDPAHGQDAGLNITVAFGFGDGRFVEKFILNQPGTELVAQDFNGDGWIDLAVASAQLVVRYNLSGNGFSFPINSGIPATLNSEFGLAITPADLDNDGDIDLLITDAEGRLDSAINNFAVFTLINGSRSIIAGERPRFLDFNNDSIPDIAYLKNLNTLIIRKGIGDGTFESPISTTAGFSAFSLYTPTTPGPSLIATTDSTASQTRIYQTDPATGLDPVPILTASTPSFNGKPQLIDLDADGELDLVLDDTVYFNILNNSGLGRTATSPVALTENDGASGFESNGGPNFILVDLNHDSAPDRARPGYIRLNTRGQNNLPRLGHRSVGPTLNIHSHVAAADLDQDGYTDIVASGFNKLELRFGRPAGPARSDDTLGPPISLAHGQANFSGFITLLIDINNDALPDIIALDRTPSVTTLINLGNRAFAPAKTLVLSSGNSDLAGIAAADLDADGDTDFVVTNDTDNQLVTILNNNGVLVIGPRLSLPDGKYTTVTLLDISGDGLPDAIIGEANANQIIFTTGNPDATFTPLGPIFLPAPPYWLTSTDANSDGIDDLLVTTRDLAGGPSPVVFWTRSPQHLINFIPTVVPTDFPALEALATDLNADGNNDLLTAQTNTQTGGIIVYNGAPETIGWPSLTRFSTELVQIQEPFPSGIIAADLNNDQLPDIVWSSNTNRIDFALQNPLLMGPCRTDIQGDAVTDSADIAAFVELFINQHPAADLNRDAVIDTADIQDFVDRFIAGC